MKIKEIEKIDKYLDQENSKTEGHEVDGNTNGTLWTRNGRKKFGRKTGNKGVIPMVLCGQGTVVKSSEERLEIIRSRIETVETIALMGPARILRTVLDT